MRTRTFVFVTVVFLRAFLSSQVFCAEWYVDGSVIGSGDGATWEAAFKSIQEGIAAATDGDRVTVAPGTYLENIHFNGKNIVLRSSDPLDPLVVAATVIDGSQAGSVVTFDGTENETCVLSRFTIENGRAGEVAGICGGRRYDARYQLYRQVYPTLIPLLRRL